MAVFLCAPFELGQLYANNGAADRVRYADYTPWTGEPLPLPETCPTAAGVKLCGGYCGTCGAGQVCTGRSPTHPYGICVGIDGSDCRSGALACGAGEKCFFFSMPDPAEGDGYRPGYCLPEEACRAAVDSLPGGGECAL